MRLQQLFSSLAICLLLVAQPLLAEKFASRGKRDPFLDLMKARQGQVRVEAVPPLSQRPPGLVGLLISEVTVAGTAGNQNRHLVILKGVDNVSYIAHEGSKLYDGHVRSISSSEVVFVRESHSGDEDSRVIKQVLTEQK